MCWNFAINSRSKMGRGGIWFWYLHSIFLVLDCPHPIPVQPSGARVGWWWWWCVGRRFISRYLATCKQFKWMFLTENKHRVLFVRVTPLLTVALLALLLLYIVAGCCQTRRGDGGRVWENVLVSASKSSIRRFVITEKAPTRLSEFLSVGLKMWRFTKPNEFVCKMQ